MGPSGSGKARRFNDTENNINANGGTVDFNTNGLSSSAILLGKNVTINTNNLGNHPVEITLTSLDLTDPTVTSDILQDIAGGYITQSTGAPFQVNGSGVATSGTILHH